MFNWFFYLPFVPGSTIEIAMTTAKASSAPPGRRCGVVLQRALLRSARPPGFRSSGYSALAAFRLTLSKARRASAMLLVFLLCLFEETAHFLELDCQDFCIGHTFV